MATLTIVITKQPSITEHDKEHISQINQTCEKLVMYGCAAFVCDDVDYIITKLVFFCQVSEAVTQHVIKGRRPERQQRAN